MSNRSFLWVALAACAVLAVSCAKSRTPEAGTNTNWLKSCDSSSECGDLSCHCGLCTKACDDADGCDGLGAHATCAPIDGLTCSQVESYCVAEREADAGGAGSGGGGAGGDASGSGGAGGDVASGSGGEGGSGGVGTVTRGPGGELQIPDGFRACEQHSDCATVTGTCSCCAIAAIRSELEDTFYEQMDVACADCSQCVLCDCQMQDLVARCEDSLCVAVPRDAERDCVSPTQNTHLAYEDGAVGCFCDVHEQSACVGSAGLICAPTEAALTWQAVEDGPCEPREQACESQHLRSTVSECLSEFATCIEQPDGTFCGERCYEPEPCPDDTDCTFAEIDHEALCSELGAPVWEGWCYQGTIRYRSSHGGFGGGTSYWNAETGELVASKSDSDTNQYCNGSSFDVTSGDLYVISMCEVVEDETTKACVD